MGQDQEADAEEQESRRPNNSILTEGNKTKDSGVTNFSWHCWGRVDDLSFFDYLSPFCFLSEFQDTFSNSYKIPTNYVYFYSILINLV